MSETTIFFLAGENSLSIDFKNAFRGAMYVWGDIAKRYCGFDRFPMFSEEDQSKVWNFGNNNPEKMPRHESIVMASTMDGALLEPTKWKQLVEAFEKYAANHPDSSIGNQATAIRKVMESDKATFVSGIGWRQTSVCGDCRWEPRDEDEEECGTYDPASNSNHFWIMEQVEDIYQDA